jgi:hypothetical protein
METRMRKILGRHQAAVNDYNVRVRVRPDGSAS